MAINRSKNVVDYCRRREVLECQNVDFQRKLHVTEALIDRLSLEHELEGHNGCVNCLEWNQNGSLLASGSDDLQLCIWRPLEHKRVQTIRTGHHGNIFTVKFVPGTNDTTVVSGAADCTIRVYDVNSKDELKVCSCHVGRIKRLATTSQAPHMYWSAAEDGTIMQFDLRTPHSCTPTCNNVFINLANHLGKSVEIKCVAINPLRPELIAVGANDPYVRIFDRRKISLSSVSRAPENQSSFWSRPSYLLRDINEMDENIPITSTQYYVAAHLPLKLPEYKKKYRTLSATYLTFSPDGRELLLNLGGEQIYIFNITKPTLVKIFDKKDFPTLDCDLNNKSKESRNGYSNGLVNNAKENISKNIDSSLGTKPLPPKAKLIKQRANLLFERHKFTEAITLYNKALEIAPSAAILFENRAASFMKRNWDGDMYAALRDCHIALKLDKYHLKTHFRMARCLFELHWNDEADECLQLFNLRFPDHAKSRACLDLANEIKERANLLAKTESVRFYRMANVTLDEDKKSKFSIQELAWRKKAYDYEARFCGHCNTTTDIKEANYFGSDCQYIVAGSDDGSIFIWDRWTTNLIRVLKGDDAIVNCLQPHPYTCLMATSGIDPVVRLWSPKPDDGRSDEREVKDSSDAAIANQKRMNADPREVMLMNMGYRIRGVFDTDEDSEGSEQSDVHCRLE